MSLAELRKQKALRKESAKGLGMAEETEMVYLPLADISPDPEQPRKVFDTEKLASLQRSIKASGQKQPIMVRPVPDSEGKYFIVYGERRWRALVELGLPEIMCLVDFKNRSALELLRDQVAENVERDNLSTLELTQVGVKMLALELGLEDSEVRQLILDLYKGRNADETKNQTVLRILEHLGCGSISTFYTHWIPQLDYPEDVQTALLNKTISDAMAKRIRGIENPEQRRAAIEAGESVDSPTVQEVQSPAKKKTSNSNLEVSILKQAIDFLRMAKKFDAQKRAKLEQELLKLMTKFN